MKRMGSGFTIVELLIVIVVIAVLAAISIAAYTNISNRANDAAVQSDLKGLATKLELYRVDNAGYPDVSVTPSSLVSLRFKASKSAYNATVSNNLAYCYSPSNRLLYKVIARSKSDTIYYISHQNNTPLRYEGAWNSNLCNNILSSENDTQYIYGGYAPSDTTTGPWRSWVGGN